MRRRADGHVGSRPSADDCNRDVLPTARGRKSVPTRNETASAEMTTTTDVFVRWTLSAGERRDLKTGDVMMVFVSICFFVGSFVYLFTFFVNICLFILY